MLDEKFTERELAIIISMDAFYADALNVIGMLDKETQSPIEIVQTYDQLFRRSLQMTREIAHILKRTEEAANA